MNLIPSLAIGLALGALITFLAWRSGSLTQSGAAAAAITGGLIFGLGGLPWAVLLLAFFISSSVLSRAFVRRKASISEKFAKGHRRDWGQVLANGGLGAVLVVIHTAFPEAGWTWLAFAGAMAAVNADTWATELGVLSEAEPHLITNGKRVPTGTSGGISALGTAAAAGGALLIALIGALFVPQVVFTQALAAVLMGGLAGSFFDSFLGATIQAIYYCPACQKETERHPVHACGTSTNQVRGWQWLNNDWVNFFCSAAGALVASVYGIVMVGG